MGLLDFVKPRLDASDAQLINRLKTGSQWQHTRGGTVYEIVCVTNTTSFKPSFPITVVYRSCSDEQVVYWSRPLTEFAEKFDPYYGVGPTALQVLREELRAAVFARRQMEKNIIAEGPSYREATRRVCSALDALTIVYNQRRK
jgi:hypothetical protein